MRGGERAAYVLTRPPGHHAGPTCSAATASSTMPPSPRRRRSTPADGASPSSTSTTTTATARSRSLRPPRRFFASLHGDPMTEYPFCSWATPTKRGEGGRWVSTPTSAARRGEQPGLVCRARRGARNACAATTRNCWSSPSASTPTLATRSHFRLDRPGVRAPGRSSPPSPADALRSGGGYASAEIGRISRCCGFDRAPAVTTHLRLRLTMPSDLDFVLGSNAAANAVHHAVGAHAARGRYGSRTSATSSSRPARARRPRVRDPAGLPQPRTGRSSSSASCCSAV